MYVVYIIYSNITDSYYIGHTQNLQARLKRHNRGQVKSTKHGCPWKIVYQEKRRAKGQAYRREMQIKSYKGGSAFKKLLYNTPT